MKKVYKLENLDCAVCAEKMKNAIAKIEGVESADVSFMLQNIIVYHKNASNTRQDKSARLALSFHLHTLS